MKALKIIGLVLALCLALLVVLALLLPKLIDPNNYRSQLEQAALEHTGLQVELAGPISWSVFPWLGLSLNELKVADRQQRPLAALNEAQVGVKLMPLLSRRLEMDTLRLNGLYLNLIRDAKGHGNWELAAETASDKMVAEESGEADAESTPDPAAEQASIKPLSLDIAAIEISDLKIEYLDQASEQKILLGPASLTTSAIALNRPFSVNALLPLESNAPELSGTLNLATQVLLKKNGLRLDQLTLKFSPKDSSSELKLSGFIQQLDQQLELQLALAPLNPKQLLKDMGMAAPETRDADALTQLSLLLRAQGDAKQLQIEPLTLELDGFSLSGPVTLSNLDTQPAIRFDLTGSELDLDRYLAPATAAKEAPAAEKQNAEQSTAQAAVPAANAELIPAETRAALKPLDIAGTLKLKQLSANKLPLKDPKLDLALKNGVLKINTLEAGLFDGRIQHQSTLDLRQQPKLSSKTQLTSVQMQPLVQAFTELDQLSGALNGDASLNSRFNTQADLLANLSGKASFKLIEGQLQGVNFNRLVCGAIAGIRKESISKNDWPNRTDFTSVQSSWQINKGVARNKDLVARLDQLELTGAGQIDLARQALDYGAGLTILGATAAEDEPACRINEKYAKVRWPVRCKGKLGQEGLCGIDSEALAQEIAKVYGGELQEKLNEKVQEKLGDDAGKLIKGLFN